MTIKDIASRAGVSKTTVSYYLNRKYDNMSKETRARIQDIIEEHGYRPNNIARRLKSRKSNTIGVVIYEFANQISLLMRGICSACYKCGYSPIIFNSYENGDIERENIQTCIDNQVGGILLSPSTTNFEYYNSLAQREIPIVLVNRYSEHWSYDAVYINHYTLVKRALRHMWDQGYRDLVLRKSCGIICSSTPIVWLAFSRSIMSFYIGQLLLYAHLIRR